MGFVRITIVGALVLASITTGCASVRPSCKIPDGVQLELESSDRLNPDERGRSLPTVLRVYQLKDLDRLEQASFDDIWTRAKETLGEAMVKQEERTLYPGQVSVHRFKREGPADFLVGVAVFRTPIGGSWRTIQEWPLAGDPCNERNDKKVAPKLEQLRVRMFLENHRIESVSNFATLPKRSCPTGGSSCRGLSAPNELPDAQRNRRLRTFEEDPSQPTPTVGPEAEQR